MVVVPIISLKLSDVLERTKFWCYVSTDEAQPQDCTVFSPVKAKWRTVYHEYFQANPNEVTNFNLVFSQTPVTPANLVASFKGICVHPLDSSAIQTLVLESNRGSSANQGQQPKRQRTSLNNDFLVTQPFKTSNYKAMILQPYNQKIVQITNLLLHILTMMMALIIHLLMVAIALLLNKNYLRTIRGRLIYSLMLNMSDGSNYITQAKASLA